jgi:hypothetical protein
VIFRDNDFEVFIDPDADNRAYGELEINALGTTWDLFLAKPYRDGGKADDGWEVRGLKSAVRVDGTINDSRDVDRAWSVELAIPWAALADHTPAPVPPRDGNQWRINFSRVGGRSSARRRLPESHACGHNWPGHRSGRSIPPEKAICTRHLRAGPCLVPDRRGRAWR